MKILHISLYYAPHVGGIEQVSRDIVSSLKGKHEQLVLCFNNKNVDAVGTIDEVGVIRVGTVAKIKSQPFSDHFGISLSRIVKSFSPDVIFFHYPNPLASHHLLKILKKYPNIRLITFWHLDITRQKFLKQFFHSQTVSLLKKSEKIIASSQNYVENSEYLSKFKDKCLTIPLCVAKGKIKTFSNHDELVNKIREENKDKIICFTLGRHVPRKGFEYLIKASALLSDKYRIYIGGKGKLTDSLKKMAEKDSKIVFLGKAPDEMISAYFDACDIFCFPSITKNEAFGIALAEAMFHGKPVITFNIPGSGVNFVSIKDVTGLEVPNSDYEKYAEAIEKLGNNPLLRQKLGKAAKERATSLFTFEKFKESINNLIDNLKR